MPNGTYGGVRGEKFIKNYPLLDCMHEATFSYEIKNIILLKIILKSEKTKTIIHPLVFFFSVNSNFA